jgi:two-component system chemotaxis response regulator CheV
MTEATAKKEILLESGTNELEIIEFYIRDGSEEGKDHYFGVNVAKVLEVIESPKGLTRPESAPHPCYMGAIDLRGKALPVLDLAVWLGMDKEQGENEVILVTEFNKRVTGFLVTGVTQIHRVSWADVESPSRYLANMKTNCITGMVEIDDHFVLFVDLESILADLDPDSMDHAETEVRAAGWTALVADDSTSMRLLLKQKLEQAAFTVQTVNDGDEAYRYLQELKAKAGREGKNLSDFLNVVVSDIEMPRMDGYTLTRRIKEDGELKTLPVILFSSLITDSLRHKGDSVGADDQISKPEFGDLAERAAGLIRRYRPGA